jgi:hypothetical protein
MTRLNRLSALVFLLATSGGCAEYDYLEFNVLNDPPLNVEIDANQIDIYVGNAVYVSVDPVSSVRTDFADDRKVVHLRSESSQVMEVRQGDGDDRWVFSGNQPGDTCVVVEVKGEWQECIPATVHLPD